MRKVFGSECPQCGDDIIAPERSQHVSDHCIRNVWSCDACTCRFDELICLSAPRLEGCLAHLDDIVARPHFLWRAT